MLLSLVRHGETDWNRARRIQGATDIPLNDTGRAQAAATGIALSRRHWDSILSSPLSRALETAQLIADRLALPAPLPVAELVERNYGEAEGLGELELRERFPGDATVPGRETRESVAARAVPALARIADENPARSIIVVSHGGLIRSVLSAVAPGDSFGVISNGSVHSLEYRDGAFALLRFDDPIEERTSGGADVTEQNAAERAP